MKKTDARERRRRERRQIGKATGFPYTDASGCIVLFNRSRQPERRRNNYDVREMELTELPRPQHGPAKK
jgi:hypothetical protein